MGEIDGERSEYNDVGKPYETIRKDPVFNLDLIVIISLFKKFLRLIHHKHMSVMELGHLLTRSGLTYLEFSSEV